MYTYSQKVHFKCIYAEIFYVSYGMLSNVIMSDVISLVLSDSDMDSENVILTWFSVSDGQKNMQFKRCIIDRYIMN